MARYSMTNKNNEEKTEILKNNSNMGGGPEGNEMVKGWFLMNFVFAEGSSLALLQTRTVAFWSSFL